MSAPGAVHTGIENASDGGGDVPPRRDSAIGLAGGAALLSLATPIIGTTLAVVGVARTQISASESSPWSVFHAWSIVLGVVGVLLAVIFVVQAMLRRPVPSWWKPREPVWFPNSV